MVKSCPIFNEVAKLGKSTQDTYNQGGWLILRALLKDRVAGGVAPTLMTLPGIVI
jgi:hypothetical protein